MVAEGLCPKSGERHTHVALRSCSTGTRPESVEHLGQASLPCAKGGFKQTGRPPRSALPARLRLRPAGGGAPSHTRGARRPAARGPRRARGGWPGVLASSRPRVLVSDPTGEPGGVSRRPPAWRRPFLLGSSPPRGLHSRVARPGKGTHADASEWQGCHICALVAAFCRGGEANPKTGARPHPATWQREGLRPPETKCQERFCEAPPPTPPDPPPGRRGVRGTGHRQPAGGAWDGEGFPHDSVPRSCW